MTKNTRFDHLRTILCNLFNFHHQITQKVKNMLPKKFSILAECDIDNSCNFFKSSRMSNKLN